jgi:NAD(P)-dependent dehydrogenase (short-subunit alcohol dehydrogenase family)
MTKRLEGRRAVISCAAANIEAATVDVFVREGASLVIGDRDLGARQTVD